MKKIISILIYDIVSNIYHNTDADCDDNASAVTCGDYAVGAPVANMAALENYKTRNFCVKIFSPK